MAGAGGRSGLPTLFQPERYHLNPFYPGVLRDIWGGRGEGGSAANKIIFELIIAGRILNLGFSVLRPSRNSAKS